MDRKGRELAAERPCVDACVDYRAIIYPADPKWLREIAGERLRARMGDAWTHTPKKQREKLRDAEAPLVQKDIDAMWDKLAELSDRSREEIETTRQDILQRVELRKKFAWYHAYERAVKNGGGEADESKFEKWLTGEGDDGAPIDNFKINVAEETAVHVILHAINLDVQNELGRHSERYPGLDLRPGLHRYYPYEDTACHVLGHLGKVGRTISTWIPTVTIAPRLSSQRRHRLRWARAALRACPSRHARPRDQYLWRRKQPDHRAAHPGPDRSHDHRH